MNKPTFHFPFARAACAAALLSLIIGAPLLADEKSLGRYQSTALQPTDEQREPLKHIIERDLGPEITTLGAAIKQLLKGSGYRLLSAKLAEPYRVMLFGMPLPEVHRQLGPIPLGDALELLGGGGFELVIDPVYRLVDFKLVARDNGDEQCHAGQ